MAHTTRVTVLSGIAGTVTIIAFTKWCIFLEYSHHILNKVIERIFIKKSY